MTSSRPSPQFRHAGIAALAALALALTACGGDTSAEETPEASGSETVVVEHAGGTTEIDTVPERVVILDDALLGDLLPFGIVPVGTAAGAGDPSVIRAWQEEAGTDEIEVVALDFEPNLEAVAAQQPDLILAMAWQVDEAYYDDLSAIAPTVAIETDQAVSGDDDVLEANLRTLGDIFRQPEAAEELIATYDERAAELREEYTDVVDRTTVAFATAYEPGQMRVDGPSGWGGAVLADVGFAFPAEQVEAIAANTDFPVRHEFSSEETERFLSTDIVVWRDNERDDLAVERGFPQDATTANPLLERLPAAEADQVFTVSDRVWFLRSVNGRLLLLDQLADDILPALRGETGD